MRRKAETTRHDPPDQPATPLTANEGLQSPPSHNGDLPDDMQACFRSLMQVAFDGIVITVDGRILQVEGNFASMFGYATDELEHLHVEQLLDPNTRAEALSRWLGDYPLAHELHCLRKDGTPFTVEACGRTVRYHGNAARITAVRDLTQRKQAEAALRAAHDQLELRVEERTTELQQANARLHAEIAERERLENELNRFFELSIDGICIADLNGHFKRVSPSLLKILGYSANELIRRPYVEFVHEEDRARTIAEAQRLISGSYVIRSFENRYRCKNGQYCWLEWAAVSLPQAGVIYAIARDLTERKETEQKLRRSERLASIGTLAAGIAHEINNPIGGILLAAELALRLEGLPEKATKPLRDITENAERAREIIQNVLRLAREGTSRKKYGELNRVIRRANALIEKHAAQRNCSIELDLGSAMTPCLLNEMEMEQVVVNLLKNSVEAGAGCVKITTQTRGEVLRLTIEDDGPGIDSEVRDRVFDPFFTTRQAAGGTGLGLSISLGIIEDHGGTIAIDSERDRGTTVGIELPVIRTESEEATAGEPDS